MVILSSDCSKGIIKGVVYYDLDISGDYNNNDVPIENQIVQIEDPNLNLMYITTDTQGSFSFFSGYGTTYSSI